MTLTDRIWFVLGNFAAVAVGVVLPLPVLLSVGAHWQETVAAWILGSAFWLGVAVGRLP
jgi:hypothetical protein